MLNGLVLWDVCLGERRLLTLYAKSGSELSVGRRVTG